MRIINTEPAECHKKKRGITSPLTGINSLEALYLFLVRLGILCHQCLYLEQQKYKDDHSGRARQFVNHMIQSLKVDAIRERKRADEAKQLRWIEFEG